MNCCNNNINKQGSNEAVRAYANLLQQHLNILVTPVDFYYAGWSGPVDTTPCSLVTIKPCCPGGQKTLALNSKHPLIRDISNAIMPGSSRYRDNTMQDIAIAMGEAMVWTGSWPTNGIDVLLPVGNIYWKMAKGLICGPQFNAIPPVKHEEIVLENSDFIGLSIWPLQLYATVLKHSKADPSNVTKTNIRCKDKWKKRDEVLVEEWEAMKRRIIGRTRRMVPRHPSVDLTMTDDPQRFRMVTFSPSLPILALAHFLQKSNKNKDNQRQDVSTSVSSHDRYLTADRVSSLGLAASILLSCDRLFCLSLFFNVPLIDRTRTLSQSISIEYLAKPTPSKEEIVSYKKEAPNDAHEALEVAMLKRAKDIWAKANGRKVIVCWSGGIDSTALLVCMFRVQNEDHKLSVAYDDDSTAENPLFYKRYLLGKVPLIYRGEQAVSNFASAFPKSLIVTGELGDQIFGSDKCLEAFPERLPTDLSTEERALVARQGNRNECEFRLEQEWEGSLLPLLKSRGLLAGESEDWIQWIKPQLQKAPFEITTLYDMLWWLNFSCKWQNVMFRCLHDGGDYAPDDEITGSIVHFYNDRQIECWACVEEFHRKKFPDLENWTSYKEPLKKIIFSFDNNEEYYLNKEKTGSLNFDLNHTKAQSVESCLGILRNKDQRLEKFSWGLNSITDCRMNKETEMGLECFLDSWIFNQTTFTPSLVEKGILVNPWESNLIQTSPFIAAPWFVDEDERKNRYMNPISAITLEAKCSVLLPPRLVNGKTVLDLGACIGAMCHWSLFHGAKKAVAVEPQKDFCIRMERYLQKAQSSWPKPPTANRTKQYEVVCADAKTFLSSCESQSFDVIVAAGVLHCFQDPIHILLELARICKEAIVIESVHPFFHRKGFGIKQNCFSNILLELNPSAAVNKAGENASFTGLAVVPTKDLMRDLYSSIGFSVTTIHLAPHPTRNEDVAVYSSSKINDANPVRFFLRCTKMSGSVSNKISSLEDVIERGEGNQHFWNDAMTNIWTNFSPVNGNKDVGKENDSKLIRKVLPFTTWYNIESNAHSVSFNAVDDAFPYRVESWGYRSKKKYIKSGHDSPSTTTYGFVYSGKAKIERISGNNASTCLHFDAYEGMYFCCPGAFSISGGSGFIVSVKHEIYGRKCGAFNVGGPIEANSSGDLIGSLGYIDGCSDSLLIHPQIKGEPCLNHLHFPPNIKQTQHTHPSGRCGLVIQGRGHCVVIDPITNETTRTLLEPGMAFVIPTDSPHAFETELETLDVIAFHPDSDFGPTNTDHPMVNRTIVNGLSASLIPSIQTKKF